MTNQVSWTDDAGNIFNANSTNPLPVALAGTPQGGSSGIGFQSGAATALAANVGQAAGKRTYISGFAVTGAGATAAIVVNVPSFGAGNTSAAVTAWGYLA